MSMDVYPPQPGSNLWLEIQRGNVPGMSVVHKFGRNAAVGTSYTPIAVGAVYQTPQVAAAATLRVKAGDANDTSAGTGAREITLEGLDETGAMVTEALATAGTSASSATSATFIRLFRAYITASGTYANASAGSHAADIVIENGAGGTDWATIDSTDFSRSQSEIAAYTIPLGKEGYIASVAINVDSNKTANIIMFKRANILETAAPYTAMRMQVQWGGVTGHAGLHPVTMLGPFPALTDTGFMAKAASSAEVDIDYEILLIDT